MRTLVIIPTYNERENIQKLVTALFALGHNLDVLVVDDGIDGVDEIIKTMQLSRENLFLAKRESKQGRGTAVRYGLRFGLARGYGYFAGIDADFSHDPQDLPRLLDKAAPDTVVVGSRYVPGSRMIGFPWHRLIFSKLSNFFVRAVLAMQFQDCTGGYRVYPRALVSRLDLAQIKTPGHGQQSEIAYRLHEIGAKFLEIPITFVNRRLGVSKFSVHEAREALFAVLRIRFSRKL